MAPAYQSLYQIALAIGALPISDHPPPERTCACAPPSCTALSVPPGCKVVRWSPVVADDTLRYDVADLERVPR